MAIPEFSENDQGLEMRIELVREKGNSYRINAVLPAGEVPEGSFRPPFDRREVEFALANIPRAVDEFQRHFGQPKEIIRDIGERLFRAICEGRVGRLYQKSFEMVKEYGQSLRIRLLINDPEMASLPWEFLFDPVRGDFVALSMRSPVVRQLGTRTVDDVHGLRPPLRILAIAAEVIPTDQGALDEIQTIEEYSEGRQLFNVERLIDATPQKTFNALQDSKDSFHVIHFIVNGMPPIIDTQSASSADQSFFEPSLVFLTDKQTDRGTGQTVALSHLWRGLEFTKSVRLIVLNGDYTDMLASQLAERYPAVIGWRGANTVHAYLAFTSGLYAAIGEGQPLDVAVTQARQKIDLDYPGGKEWGMPVFYMQTPSGLLLQRQERFKEATPRSFSSPKLKKAKAPIELGKQREWKKLEFLMEIESKNLESLTVEMGKFISGSVPSYLQVQHDEIKSKIDRLKLEMKQLSK